MALSPILSRDIVATRLLFNAIKREKYIDFLKDSVVGDYKWSACNVSFHGWMKCDGSALSRTTYSALYNVIGTTYGSNNASDFKLPDCRGRALFAAGQPVGGNITYNAHTLVQGERFGNQKHLLTVSEMPSHTHTHNGTGPTGAGTDGYGLAYQDGSSTMNADVNSGNEPNLYSSLAALNIDNTGGSTAHDIQNPSIVVGNVFLYSGVFEPYVPLVDEIGPNDNTYDA